MEEQETPRTMAQQDMTSWLNEVESANEVAARADLAAIDELSEALEASYAAGDGDTDSDELDDDVAFPPDLTHQISEKEAGEVKAVQDPEEEDREQADPTLS